MIAEFENFMLDICTRHKDIRHGHNGLRAWVPYGSGTAAPIHSKIAPLYLTHEEFVSSNLVQGELMVFQSVIAILNNVSTRGNLEQNIQAARNKTFSIVLDIIAYLQEHEDNPESFDECLPFESIRIEAMEPIGMEDQSAFGWELIFEISKYKPSYNTSKWL